MKRILFLMFCVLPVLHACAGKGETPLSDPPFKEVCVLNQEENPLGVINSIDYVSDSLFVVCTESQIYLYNYSGDLVRKIGRTGHAKTEYVSPFVARADANRIFAWDGMLAKFVCFGVDGQFISEMSFDKAVADFLVDGDYLWIYSSNAKSDACILKMNTLTGEYEALDFMPVSGGHHLLIRWMSRAPMAICDDVLWCMPKNKLEIYRSNSSKIISLESDSFNARDVDDPVSLIRAREKMEEYMRNNSFVVAVRPKGSVIQVLTTEGYVKEIEGEMDRSHRYYSIYSYNQSNGKTDCAVRFPIDSFSPYLVMTGSDGFYCLSHEIIDEEDQYCLEKLVL